MNKVILLGNLTKDPMVKATANGVPYCAFTVACNRQYKNADGKRDADFINCVAWRERAEFMGKWFSKGKPVCVEGSIQTRSYEKDGEKRYYTEVVADKIEFAGSKESAQSADGSRNANANRYAPPNQGDQGDVFAGDYEDFEPIPDSELPF